MTPEAQRVVIGKAMGYFRGSELGYTDEQAKEFYRPDPEGNYHDLATWSKKHV